ncbi:MAG: CHASE domain-containing protein, partial [Candidatus Competibacterales bacterium]|nr:CHASE domain-containing protein [Candidatus Competibacterales bacterium]
MRPITRQLNLFLPLLLVAGLVAGGGYVAERLDHTRAQQSARASVLDRLGTLRARLEGSVNANLFLVRGLIAEIALNPNLSQVEFARIAQQLLRTDNQIRNIGAARDLVLTHIYPLSGNRAALGLDYRHHPTQRDAALRAVTSGEMVVAGPLPLVQGGTAFVGRMPVYVAEGPNTDPVFWGLVSAVIDADQFYREAGLYDPDLALTMAIRGRDALGAEGEVFYGSEDLFTSNAVRLEVTVPGGSWQLAAAPMAGWPPAGDHVWPIRTTVGSFILLVFALGLLRTHQMGERQRAEQDQFRLLDQLRFTRQAVDNSPDSIAVVDRQGRFVHVNPGFARCLDRTPAGLEGLAVSEVAPLQRLDAAAETHLEQALAGNPIEFDSWFDCVDLGPRDVMVRYSPLTSESGGTTGAVLVVHDLTERRRAERVLNTLVEGTARTLGQDFFRNLVRHLAQALQMRCALIGELLPGEEQVRTRAVWDGNDYGRDFHYPLEGSPCSLVLRERHRICVYPRAVAVRFPQDPILQAMQAESYIGVPLSDCSGAMLGLLA